MKTKKYLVTVTLSVQEVAVVAINERMAKRKALRKLSAKPFEKLIHKTYPDNKKDIFIDVID
jgi:hypothetical protein